MGKSKFITRSILVLALFILLPVSANAAPLAQDTIGDNFNLIILTPGHSRTIYYDLDSTVLGGRAFQTTFIITAGEGTLLVSVANNSTLGEGAEMIFATTGFVGTTPVLNYSYSSAPITMTVPVSTASVGILVTGLVLTYGQPDFPVTMSMMFSLN